MNGNDTFLDINNAHLRVNSGNVQASTFVLDQINIVTSANTNSTVNFNNVTKAFNAASNIEVGTANLFVDTTTSNVGINTNSPQQTLHINGGTLIGGHVLPTQHEQFDIGSADAKIRHMFLSDNSLWIGDEAKLSFTGNQLKFRRRKKNAVPRGLVAIGAAQDPELNESTLQTNALAHANKPSVGDMKLEHWLAYAKTLDATKELSDVFTNQDADYDVTSASEAFKEIGNEIYSTHKLRLGSSVVPTATLDITGTAKVSGDVTVDTDTFHIDTTNNRVGIGASAPACALDIAGEDVMIRGNTPSLNFSEDTSGMGGGFRIHYDGANQGDDNNFLAIQRGTNFADTSLHCTLGGRVGIGTPSPIAALDIDGGPENDIVPALSIRGGQYTESDLYVLNSYNNSTVGGVGYAAKVIGVNIKNKLETDNKIKIRSNTGGLTCGSAMYLGTDDAISGVFGVLTGDGAAGTTLTEKFTVRVNGNIGVGTTNPTEKFHMHENLSTSGHQICARIGGTASSSYNTLVFGSKEARPHIGGHRGDYGAWADLSFQNDLMVLKQSNMCVGINKTNPTYPLDVHSDDAIHIEMSNTLHETKIHGGALFIRNPSTSGGYEHMIINNHATGNHTTAYIQFRRGNSGNGSAIGTITGSGSNISYGTGSD